MKLKTYLFIATAFIFTFTMQSQIKTPQLSPTAKIEQNIGLTDVKLEYSRPSKRGRIIFGDLVPYGKKWRTGANANTKITFSTDVTIDGKTLKKGTYAIYSIPNKNQWEIIFYKDYDNWGLPKKWDESKVALKVPARVRTLTDYVETFTIGFDYFNDPNMFILSFTWDTTSAVLKVHLPTDKIALESINKIFDGPTARDYYSAASYFRTNGKDINKAAEWINKAVKMSPETYWITREQSLILLQKGDKKGAIAAAERSLRSAEKAGDDNYVRMNKAFLKENK